MEISRRSFLRGLAKGLACSPVLFMTGCDTDSLLGLEPKGELSSEAVWSDASLIESYLTEIYAGVGWGYGDPTIAGGADEAKNTHGHGDAPMRLSNMTPTNRGFWDWDAWVGHEGLVKFQWDRSYGHFRNLNIFLENIQESDAVTQTQKDTLMGEAYFLRAYYYHWLLRLYGGVPVIEEPFELGADESQYQVPRSSFAETVDFIVADCDRAAERLSLPARELGRPSQGAALALKSRVLLHAASDLFAENPSGMPETGYTSGDQQSRWRAAKDAAQAVMDLGHYSLYQGAYEDMWLQENHSEMIWARHFTESADTVHNHSLWTSPNGYGCWGGDTPLQNHVDKYEMADGRRFDWNNPEQAGNPYQNRDPRFYANIHYNGRVWRERGQGGAAIDPRGVIQTGWYEVSDSENLRPGLDTREGPIQDWNGTKTGYYLRKFHDKNIDPNNEQAYNPWTFLRYGEVLLNYAEASAELGETSDALQAVNQIRARVDMPDIPAGGGEGYDSLLDHIRNERAVELAFEEHRYFDTRRWMTAPETYENGRGIQITGSLDEDGELLVNNRYSYEYEVVQVDERDWNDKAYFLPISQEEMQRNPELVQNPGY